MKHILLFLIFAVLPLSACQQTLQQQANSIGTNLTSALSPSTTTKQMHGIVLTVKSCSISPTRVATCRFTATSQYQDRELSLLGAHYTRLQDDTGVSYNTMIAFGQDPTDKTQRHTTLVADTPYEFTLMAENISTQATKVRAITINRMDVKGSKLATLKMNFSHPPMVASTMTAQKPVADQSTYSGEKTTSVPAEDMPYRYMFAKIVPVNSNLPRDPMQAKGAYLHLREDGALGHNFSKPGPYGYVPKQGWRMDDEKLVIIFDQISYTFDLEDKTIPMITYLDQGGLYKMTAYPKHKNEM